MKILPPLYCIHIILVLHLGLFAQQSDSTDFFSRVEYRILFETGEFRVDSIDDEIVQNLHSWLRNNPGGKIRLEGRTDNVGTAESNMVLARNRVEQVKKELLKRQFGEADFVSEVYGQHKPVASNDTESGRQLNRSVLIRIGELLPAETIKGRIVTPDRSGGVESMLFVQSKHHFFTVPTDADGSFELSVPKASLISIEAYGKGYVYEKEFFDIDKSSRDLGLLVAKPIEPGAIFNFSDILFVVNLDSILPESRKLLPRLLLVIQGSPGYKFEIQGHVHLAGHKRGEKSVHYRLSEDRAEEVYNYLISHGADPDRLVYKGYSNWEMLHPNATDESLIRENRRVSIKVLGRVDTLRMQSLNSDSSQVKGKR